MIQKLNRRFLDEGKHYIVVGPDAGEAVTRGWYFGEVAQHFAAGIIVEAGLTNYRVDPSQGTHLPESDLFRAGDISPSMPNTNDGMDNQALLDSMPAVEMICANGLRNLCPSRWMERKSSVW